MEPSFQLFLCKYKRCKANYLDCFTPQLWPIKIYHVDLLTETGMEVSLPGGMTHKNRGKNKTTIVFLPENLGVLCSNSGIFIQSVLFTSLMTVMRTTITAKKEFMEELTLTCKFGGMGVHDGRQA